jgi:hypothetical protein
MVTLPSLEKIRASERVVMFGPTTRGLMVYPDTYSTALKAGGQNARMGKRIINRAHAVIERIRRLIKLHVPVRVVVRDFACGYDIRESHVLYPSDGVPACDKLYHFRRSEAHAGECIGVRLECILRLRNARRTGLDSVHTAATEVNLRSAAGTPAQVEASCVAVNAHHASTAVMAAAASPSETDIVVQPGLSVEDRRVVLTRHITVHGHRDSIERFLKTGTRILTTSQSLRW